MTLALEVTADLGGVVVAALAAAAFLAAVALLWRRTGRVETKLGTIEVGVSEVSRQVNHVQDATAEPTLRELVVAMHGQLTEVRQDVKVIDRRVSSVEVASIMHGERLGEIGTLARQTADTLGRHLEERP